MATATEEDACTALLLTAATGWADSASMFRLRGACRALRSGIDGEEACWRHALRRDFRVPFGKLTATQQHPPLPGRALWLYAFRTRTGVAATPLDLHAYTTAKWFWDRVEAWALEHLPALFYTLSDGPPSSVYSALCASIEQELGCPIPSAVKALFRVRSQSLLIGGSKPPSFQLCGLLGGVSAYGGFSSTFLMMGPGAGHVMSSPRGKLLRIGSSISTQNGMGPPSAHFAVHPATGMVYTVVYNDDGEESCHAAAPRLAPGSQQLAAAQARFGGCSPVDAQFWLWLWEYLERLERGCYAVSHLRDSPAYLQRGELRRPLFNRPFRQPLVPGSPVFLELSAILQGCVDQGRRSQGDSSSSAARGPLTASDAEWYAQGQSSVLESQSASALDPDNLLQRYISAFPEIGLQTSLAETEGVHVHVSSVFTPTEGSSDAADVPRLPFEKAAVPVRGAPPRAPRSSSDDGDAFRWAYRVRMWLSGAPLSPYPQVQLSRRSWCIGSDLGAGMAEVEEVEGEGVVGLFPVLRACDCDPSSLTPGPVCRCPAPSARADQEAAMAAHAAFAASQAPWARDGFGDGLPGPPIACFSSTDALAVRHFEYTSRTAIGRPVGYMEGGFTMVPGSLDEPLGDPEAHIVATVAQWRLGVPEFIFYV